MSDTPDIPDAVLADPEVQHAIKSMVLKAVAKASHLLDSGSPDRQDRMIGIWAAPAVKEVLNPKPKTAGEQEADVVARTAEFHELRRAMLDFGDTDAPN